MELQVTYQKSVLLRNERMEVYLEWIQNSYYFQPAVFRPFIVAELDELVTALCKPGSEILATMTPDRMHLLHMASKLASEAGELVDAIGKLCFYNKELDVCNVVEELGDIEFYLEGLRQQLMLTRDMALQANIKKLQRRYEKGYSDKAAQQRADKKDLEQSGRTL